MKKKALKFTRRNAVLAAVLGLLGASAAQATPVHGTVHAVDATDPRGAGTTIDYWQFTLDADAPNFGIDIRANEGFHSSFGNVPSGYVDLNGDGEITLADTQFRVFYTATYPLTAAAEYAANDDDGFTYASGVNLGWSDGSLISRDSFLRGFFSAGTYILAIGDYQITQAEAIAGFNKGDTLTALGTAPSGQDHFDYQITLSTNFNDPTHTGITPFQVYGPGEASAPAAVPVPAAAWLFGSALLGFGGLKRRAMNVRSAKAV